MKEPPTQPIPARRGRPKKDAPLVPVSVRLDAALIACVHALTGETERGEAIRAALQEWREWKRSGLKSGPF